MTKGKRELECFQFGNAPFFMPKNMKSRVKGLKNHIN